MGNNYLIGPRQSFHQIFNGALIAGPAVVANEFVVATVVQTSSGGSFYINGSFYGNNGNNTAPGILSLPYGSASSEILNGYIAEVIVYSYNMVDSDRQNTESYLIDKWDL